MLKPFLILSALVSDRRFRATPAGPAARSLPRLRADGQFPWKPLTRSTLSNQAPNPWPAPKRYTATSAPSAMETTVVAPATWPRT